MPKYELMYILSSQVSDDQIPGIEESIQQYLVDNKATNIETTVIGKKKLAYPIGKTRNGHYVLVNFEMDSRKVNTFEAKLRTQKNVVIRHLIVNIDDHLKRKKKDEIAQAKIPKRVLESAEAPKEEVAKAEQEAVKPIQAEEKEVTETTKTAKPRAPKKKKEDILDITTEELDKKIDAALSEDILK